MKRREFLQLIGATTLVAAACGDNASLVSGGSDAAAIFEPTSSAFLVSVWSALGKRATVEVVAGGDVVATLELVIDDAGQGIVDVTGLVADVAYDVTISIDTGARLGPHRVRTAPTDDATRAVRIAVSADWDPQPEFDTELIPHVVAAEPELYVSIGDFPYTDNGPIAQTVALYRERHAALRADPRARALHEACGVRAIYDDHEFRNNWDAKFVAAEPARYSAAMQVWDEFFPLRDAPAGVRYRSWRWGANVECFLLDCRRFRSADAAPDDSSKTMLGATQLAWLLAGLAASTATFKLVFTSIPLDYGVGNDHWATFTTERQVIFDSLLANEISGVLFVSGDQHWFASQTHAYGLRELQIGPVARGFGTPPEPQPAGVKFRAVRYNVGIIDIAEGGASLTFSGLGDDGSTFYSETVTAAELTPKA